MKKELRVVIHILAGLMLAVLIAIGIFVGAKAVKMKKESKWFFNAVYQRNEAELPALANTDHYLSLCEDGTYSFIAYYGDPDLDSFSWGTYRYVGEEQVFRDVLHKNDEPCLKYEVTKDHVVGSYNFVLDAFYLTKDRKVAYVVSDFGYAIDEYSKLLKWVVVKDNGDGSFERELQ